MARTPGKWMILDVLSHDGRHIHGGAEAGGWTYFERTICNEDGVIVACVEGKTEHPDEGFPHPRTLEELIDNAELIASAPAVLAERDALKAENERLLAQLMQIKEVLA